jgi:GNAT superfamily N-acetyltransferase
MTAPLNSPSSNSAACIRPATDADIPPLTRLINTAFVVEQIVFHGDRVDEPAVRSYAARGTFLVAEDCGTLAGCVYIERLGDRTYLGLLSVLPARQGTGLGSRLMHAAENLARSLGAKIMDLRVISARADQLLPFYLRLGYRPVASEAFPPDLAPKIPSHYIVMSKPLV